MLENQNVGGNSGALGAVDASSLGVGDVLGQVKSLLQKAASASGSDIFSQVLGDKANTLEIQAVRSAWSLGDFSQLPSIQILSAANMNGAFGGYASSTKTVYLSDALFKPDAAPVDSLLGAAGVLTEETFHWLDDRVGVDTQGDEGELARMLIFGTSMSSAELTRIKQENDSGFITVEQQLTPVEMATPTLVSIESLGNTKLVKDTSNFLYAQVGSNTPISIKYNGQAITSTSFPGWQTLAVETISGQNRVLWKDTINNTISVWQTDSNWNYLSTSAASTLNSPDALTQEINFGLDLNGDNVLGNTFSSIESLGNTKLVKDTSNFLYAQVGSNTPISIKYNGQAITSTSFPGWQTLAVETISGQNRILWKDTINNTISVWQTDSNWNYLSTTAASTLNSPDALTQEINFGLDLNGDSKLGTTYTSIESLGNTKLVKDTSNFLYAQVGSNTPISIKYNGQAITSTSFPGWQTLAVETISGQNRILWKDTINNTISVWQTDSNWNYLSTTAASTLNSPDALTQEINFGLDLNGDSKLGTTYTSIESLGNTKLVKDTSNFLYAQVGSNTPISIKYNGQAITSTSFPGWQTLAVETISGQNRVLWKDTINNTISVWQTDSNWNYLSTSNAIALNSPDSLIQETNFGLDLNSDGIVGSSPDLVITGQTAPSTVTVGGSVTIGAYTKNNGNGNAGSSYVGYWLSNNTTLDSSDIYINSGYISPLNAGASQYNSWTFTYNSSWGTGTKYVLFEADSSGGFVTESNESNNVAYATIFVSPPPSPDLVITGQTATSTVTVGGNVSVGAYTQNNGNASAGSNYVRYWLSNDTTLDSNDTFINWQSVNSLSAGASQYNSLNFTYNSSWGTGTKYILFQADGYSNVAESNELNNVTYATIFVTPPSPDLVITGQTATSTVTVGGNVSVGAYTQNNGNASAGSNYVRYWLSNDTTLDSNDTFINWQSVNSLSAGASQYNSLNFTYNSSWGTGTKYILFQADGYSNVAESNELNNVTYATIFVTPPSPDLVITGQTATSTVTVGGNVSVGAYTQNNGNASAGSNYVRYWLSNDTTLDSNDTFINWQSVNSLSAGASQYNSLNFTYNSSWGTGTKYILFQADGYSNVAESNELNNVTYATIFVTPPSPDLVITGQTATSTVTVGGNVTVGAYTQNNGNASAGSNYVRYWLSNDTTLDSNDTFINWQSVNSLSAGASQYNSLNFTYNSSWGTGTKYILFQADGYSNVAESNELNNVTYATIFVTPPSTLVTISNMLFSGYEGDSGTFQIRLNQAPTSNISLTFNAGSFLTIDSDNKISNGTQNTITFTSSDWSTARTVWFIAEKDGSSASRTSGNTIGYTLSGAQSGSGSYDLGTVINTYATDSSRYNIDLDFRNDSEGFWTTQRRNIAQQAANDWASRIANELSDFSLNNRSLGMVGVDGVDAFQFTTNRFIDDMVVFVGSYNGGDAAAGWGGSYSALGGWTTTEPLARAAEFTVNSLVASSYSDAALYSVFSHELGHGLGLLGQNQKGANLIDKTSPSTAVFKGAYAKAANGGSYVALQSQDGTNPVTGQYDYSHPSNSVMSMMSYGYTYMLTAPTNIDYAMLADIGYSIKNINA